MTLSCLVLLGEHMSDKPVLCIQVNEETQLRLLEAATAPIRQWRRLSPGDLVPGRPGRGSGLSPELAGSQSRIGLLARRCNGRKRHGNPGLSNDGEACVRGA